jgi:hypothetical protein
MFEESQSHQSIYIEQIYHGKLAKISWTSLLLKTGASGSALRTGSPVVESVTILTLCGRCLRGVKTIRPASMLASSGSPSRIPSLRRRGPGRTTCPFGRNFGLHCKTILPEFADLHQLRTSTRRAALGCRAPFAIYTSSWNRASCCSLAAHGAGSKGSGSHGPEHVN